MHKMWSSTDTVVAQSTSSVATNGSATLKQQPHLDLVAKNGSTLQQDHPSDDGCRLRAKNESALQSDKATTMDEGVGNNPKVEASIAGSSLEQRSTSKVNHGGKHKPRVEQEPKK